MTKKKMTHILLDKWVTRERYISIKVHHQTSNYVPVKTQSQSQSQSQAQGQSQGQGQSKLKTKSKIKTKPKLKMLAGDHHLLC